MSEMSNKLVSIIIPTIGAKNYIFSCLDSLESQSYPETEIIVIDNSLKAELRNEISRCCQRAKLAGNKWDLCYSGAMNLGINKSKGEFILCLNDDVILDKYFIENALKGFRINDKIGMVSGKILRQDRKIIDSTGLFLTIFRTARERGYNQANRGQFEKPGYVFGVTGAVAFYKKQMLEQIKDKFGYFDNRFGYFYEDLDLAWRANKRGWRGYYMPKAIAYHVRGGTARQDKDMKSRFARDYLSFQLYFNLVNNRYLMIMKNESVLKLLIFWPFIMPYDIVAIGYFIFRLVYRGCALIRRRILV